VIRHEGSRPTREAFRGAPFSGKAGIPGRLWQPLEGPSKTVTVLEVVLAFENLTDVFRIQGTAGIGMEFLNVIEFYRKTIRSDWGFALGHSFSVVAIKLAAHCRLTPPYSVKASDLLEEPPRFKRIREG